MHRFAALNLLGLAALIVVACGGGDDDSSIVAPGRIAFVSDRDGNQEIYVMNADGSAQVNLTQNSAVDEDPWWSPDGSEISFRSMRAGQSDLWTMDADGKNVKRVTNDGAVDGQLRWSPDGQRIAYYSFAEQEQGYLWVANADGGDPKAVLTAIHPAGVDQQCAGGFPGGWFPDGQHILYRGSWGEGSALQICSAKSDGSEIHAIYGERGASATYPAFSPDGSKIAFVTNRDGNDEIYVMDADGSNLQRVTDDDAPDEWPSWSPDGTWIVFASQHDESFEIRIMHPDGSGLKKLTDNATGNNTKPAWSPN